MPSNVARCCMRRQQHFCSLRVGRGARRCSGMRPTPGAHDTSVATCGPVRPESEALRRRAQHTGPQSTGVFCPCRFQHIMAADFPRPRSGRGVSCYGGKRPAWGACRTSAATCGPVRPESEALRRRARQTVPQSTGASRAADLSNSSSLVFLVREASEV